MPDIHVPMRWADLDQLNHVNNAVYIDYALEARAQLVDDGELANRPLRRVGVDFVRPMFLSTKSALVRSSIDGDVLAQEIRSHDASALFCRVLTEHGHPRPIDDKRGAGAAIHLRRDDVGSDGTVTLGRLFDLFQEARTLYFRTVLPARSAGRFVIGRLELDLGEPLPWQSEPRPVQSYIAHVGRSSFQAVTRIEGGRFGSMTTTLVGFDRTDQVSRRLDDDERTALEAALLAEQE